MAENAKFVHPKELGLDFPIWSRDQQIAVARSLSGLPPKRNTSKVSAKEIQERKKYMELKEKYGK